MNAVLWSSKSPQLFPARNIILILVPVLGSGGIQPLKKQSRIMQIKMQWKGPSYKTPLITSVFRFVSPHNVKRIALTSTVSGWINARSALARLGLASEGTGCIDACRPSAASLPRLTTFVDIYEAVNRRPTYWVRLVAHQEFKVRFPIRRGPMATMAVAIDRNYFCHITALAQ